MTTALPRPPYDPDLEAVLALDDRIPATITPEMIPRLRKGAPLAVDPNPILADAGISRRDVQIPGYLGADIVISILQKEGRTGMGPGVYYVHGGGMIMGDRWAGIQQFVPWILRFDAIVVTVEYRLAPEFRDPIPVEDCYAGLVWTAANAEDLGVDPSRLIIAGTSAGGGLAAGTTLLARNRHGPALAGQVLIYPMLDDRDTTVSAAQFEGVGVWDRTSNITGWAALLGDRAGTDDVSIYAAPGRAEDLSGLPPTFIDCGSAEVFRDEDVAYATALWQAGGQAELHIWPGGFHGFDTAAPDHVLAKAMTRARDEWIGRIFAPRPTNHYQPERHDT
jgi:acetyl esterase/lipase